MQQHFRKAGLPNCISLIPGAASCRTAEEARDKVIAERLGPDGGENIHIIDRNGTAFVIEHTAAGDQVRVPGDHGESGYLLAANHFLTREKEASNFSGKEYQAWMNSYFRYWTEQRLLRENYGKISLAVINRILGCQKFWGGEDLSAFRKREWTLPEEIKNGWNSIRDMGDQGCVERMGKFSPEIQTREQKCVFSALLYPERREFYILSGCRDTGMSMNPWAAGVFTKLKLAERREAKTAYAEGVYWKSKAVCEKKRRKRYRFWSYSATAYMKALRYSLMTLKEAIYDEPEKLSV